MKINQIEMHDCSIADDIGKSISCLSLISLSIRNNTITDSGVRAVVLSQPNIRILKVGM